MSRAIFRTSLLVCLLVLIFTAGVFFFLRRSQAEDETYAALRQEAFYAEQGLLRDGEEYLRDLGSINRVTWILPDGEVAYDSVFPDENNQLSCPEVRAALDTGEGQGIRRSRRSGVQTIYVARLCADGTVLRLSRPLSAVRTAIASVTPALWVVVLALLLSLLSAFRSSKRIIRPINEMDLDHADAAAPYPELTPLLERIQEQKRTIAQQNAERETLRREFTANVSHELKTPLTSISGFAELMAQGSVPPEKVQEFSADIYRESQRLIDLVPLAASPYTVQCSNTERFPIQKTQCDAGCRGCGVCAKNCPSGAIQMENNLARIDYSKCTGCGTCAQKCPAGCISFHDIPVAEPESKVS